MRKLNKKGAVPYVALLLVILLAAVVYFGSGNKLPDTSGLNIGGQSGGNNAPAGNAGGGITVNTAAITPSISAYDSQAFGTAVTVTTNYGVNDQPLSTSAPGVSPGDKLVVLVNGSSYHSALVSENVPNGVSYVKAVPMNKNASLTMAVYNTAKSAMSNGATGATNQTVATGGAYTMELDITGTSQASTQDMICILEGSDTSKINKLVLNGFGATFIGTAKPASYTLGATTSGVWVYSVPPIADASLKTGSIYAESKAGQAMTSKYFKITCFSKDYFVDSSANALTVNPFASLVAQPNVWYGIEDSVGTQKSIAVNSFTGYFQ